MSGSNDWLEQLKAAGSDPHDPDASNIRQAIREIERLQADLATWAFKAGSAAGTLAMERDACLKRLAENDEEIVKLRAAAAAAKALVNECADCGYRHEVPEHKLVALESALETAGYGMTEEEAAEMLAAETSAVPDPQLCSCRDGARYRFIRQGEDELPSEHEKAFAAMWADINLKGYWREAMDNRIDAAMQQLKPGAAL